MTVAAGLPSSKAVAAAGSRGCGSCRYAVPGAEGGCTEPRRRDDARGAFSHMSRKQELAHRQVIFKS